MYNIANLILTVGCEVFMRIRKGGGTDHNHFIRLAPEMYFKSNYRTILEEVFS